MGPTWYSPDPAPEPQPIGVAGWGRVLGRGAGLAVVLGAGLGAFAALRLFEVAALRSRRVVTPVVSQQVSRAALRMIGLSIRVEGVPLSGPGAVVANHVSWLDILVLNAAQRVFFVSKSEVAHWPGIGFLARITGTEFITRRGADAARQKAQLVARLSDGARLLFFPEGTSSDGLQILPFKPTLFAAFFEPSLRDRLALQPATLRYHAPRGADARVYGWWGDMGFGPHFLAVLARPRQGGVTVVLHSAVRVGDFDSRKQLAAQCEAMVRAGLPANADQ